MIIEVSKLFQLMQNAYYSSPCWTGNNNGFRYRMSNFTYKVLIEDCQKFTDTKLINYTSFLGIPIELDDMMPDYTFHLYGRNQLEQQDNG
jgi:hypothetical protein